MVNKIHEKEYLDLCQQKKLLESGLDRVNDRMFKLEMACIKCGSLDTPEFAWDYGSYGCKYEIKVCVACGHTETSED